MTPPTENGKDDKHPERLFRLFLQGACQFSLRQNEKRPI